MTDGNDMANAGVEYVWREGVAEVAGQFFGLTKREAFAMAAMQGLLAAPGEYPNHEDLGAYSVMYADILIAALNKPQETKP